MDLFLAFVLILFILMVGLIPFSLLYILSDFVRVLLFHMFKYRRPVVELNLRETFTSLSAKEIGQLSWKFYRNLSDVLLEGIKAFTMTRKQIRSRHKILNPEVALSYFQENRSCIAVPSHYGNWEWGSMSGALQLPQNNVVFYKPLKNKHIDRYTRWSRAKYDGKLVSIYDTRMVFEQHQANNSIFIMASDQSPANVDKAIWVDFLGRQTAFLPGPEAYAKKYDLPVIFVDIQRVRRGYYELTLEIISDTPRETAEGEITQRYATMLETAIQNQPENWLWTHRRWKHRR